MAIQVNSQYDVSKEEFINFIKEQNPWLEEKGLTSSQIYEFGAEEYDITLQSMKEELNHGKFLQNNQLYLKNLIQTFLME